MVLIAVMYSGAERFLSARGSYLHYAFDALLLVLVVLSAIPRGVAIMDAVRSLWFYETWILAYFGWGLLVSPDRTAVSGDALRAIELNTFVLLVVGVLLRRRRDLVLLANMTQITVIINLAISLAELLVPALIPRIGHALGPSAIVGSFQRPAGLYVNPNEAAIAFLMAFLIAHWARPALAWIGRLAAIASIILTGSRGGMYPLLLCVATYGFVALARRRHLDLRRFALGGGARRIASAGVVIGAALLGFFLFAKALSYPISRFLNPVEATVEVGDVPRTSALSYWVGRALARPWFGSGVFSFQGSNTFPGAHNIYLAVWGETGLPFVIVYLIVLAAGVLRCLNRAIRADDRLSIGLMWLAYLLEGFLWHNQFTSLLGILLIALLFQIPHVLAQDPSQNEPPAHDRPTELNAVKG